MLLLMLMEHPKSTMFNKKENAAKKQKVIMPKMKFKSNIYGVMEETDM